MTHPTEYRSFKELLHIIYRHTILYYILAVIILMACVNVQKSYGHRWQKTSSWRNYPIQYNPLEGPPDKNALRRSILYYQLTSEVSPGLSRSYGIIGWCYYLLGDKQKSILFYRQALRKQPRFFWFDYNLGVLYYQLGDYQKSTQYLNKIQSQTLDQMLFSAIFFNAFNKLKGKQKIMFYTLARSFTVTIYRNTHRLLYLNAQHLHEKENISTKADDTFTPAFHPWVKFIPLGKEHFFSTLFGGTS